MYARPCIRTCIIPIPTVCLAFSSGSFPHVKRCAVALLVSDQLETCRDKKYLPSMKESEDETLTFTTSIFLHFKLDPCSKQAECLFSSYLRDINCRKDVFRLSWFTHGTTHDITYNGKPTAYVEFEFYSLDFDVCHKPSAKEKKVYSQW